MENFSDIKNQLFNKCLEYVDHRIKNAKEALDAAKEAGNEETKSSAGDKYEVGRAMMQQEIENNELQLGEAYKLKKALNLINPAEDCQTVKLGSLVLTTNGNFYISISLGKLSIDSDDYFAISPLTPIGIKLSGLKKGDKMTFNKKDYLIQGVY